MNKNTKVICTMGPASDGEDTLLKMMQAGMNIARFNFSHGTHADHKERVDRVRRVAAANGFNIGVLQDTKGPEIRLGNFINKKVQISDGGTFTLRQDDKDGDETGCSITYKDLYKDVEIGTAILINDGIVELRVSKITDTNDIVCDVIHGGTLSNHKSVNVPSVHLNIPFLSDVDKADLEFGAEMQYDFVALSFVRCAQDVIDARYYMKKFNYEPFIIAKIENQEGVDNLEAIVQAADGIMVARGDMGVEISFEMVPHIQHQMIKCCLSHGKVVIVATNMLESMCENPRPTRAEVSDVANAVYQGATCTMLSGESAAGRFPINAVETMSKINMQVEHEINVNTNIRNSLVQNTKEDTSYQVVSSAIALAENINAKAIVCASMSGSTIRKVSSFAPRIPIIGCSPYEKVYKECSILYGTTGLMIPQIKTDDELINEIKFNCVNNKLLNPGDKVILVAGYPVGESGKTNSIRVIKI